MNRSRCFREGVAADRFTNLSQYRNAIALPMRLRESSPSLVAQERRSVKPKRHALWQCRRPACPPSCNLGDVGGVVAHLLDVLGAKKEVNANADIARIFHHVGEQLAEQRVVDGDDFLVPAAHRADSTPAILT